MAEANNAPPVVLQTAFNVLPFPLAILDSTGTIRQVNDRWETVAAGTAGPIASGAVGDRYLAALDADAADAADAADTPDAADTAEAETVREVASGIQSLLDGAEDVISVECPIEDDNGIRWELLRGVAFETPEERYVAIAGVDISDQKRISADLQVKERAMDEAPVGITISDPSTEDNEIVYANEAFERITGYDTDYAVGRNCRFLQGEETSEESVAKMRTAVENREPVVAEVLNYRKNGEKFWNEVTIAPLHDDGELTHFLGFQRDITARKQAQQELSVERDRLALLNQLVRHDIRNDMAVILGWGEHLYEQASEDQQEDLRRILNTASHTKRLTESVRDLLELLRQDDPELSAIDLGETLREEIERVRSSFEYRSDSVSVTGEDSLPEGVAVRATPLLSSVFGNLLDNAVFHNDEAEIEIHVAVEEQDSTVVVRIADNGPGVPDPRKRAVFGRGEKGMESPGSGLGLYLIDNLVDTYGGSVWIEDNDPEGSVFCVELQRA